MKIELELPDWVDGRELYIHAYPVELVAVRRNYGQGFENWDDSSTARWYVKTSRCNMCGDCCRGLGDGFPYRNENGDCKYLLPDGKCPLGIHKPFSCIMDWHDDPKLKPLRCSEEFKLVE